MIEPQPIEVLGACAIPPRAGVEEMEVFIIFDPPGDPGDFPVIPEPAHGAGPAVAQTTILGQFEGVQN